MTSIEAVVLSRCWFHDLEKFRVLTHTGHGIGHVSRFGQNSVSSIEALGEKVNRKSRTFAHRDWHRKNNLAKVFIGSHFFGPGHCDR